MRGWGVKGLWFGLAAAEAPLLVFYLFVLARADWQTCCIEALRRVDWNSETDTDSDVSSVRGGGCCGGDDEALASGCGFALAEDGRGDGYGGASSGGDLVVDVPAGGAVTCDSVDRIATTVPTAPASPAAPYTRSTPEASLPTTVWAVHERSKLLPV